MSDNSANNKRHKILEIVERIDEVKKIPTFNDTVYEIDRDIPRGIPLETVAPETRGRR